MVLWVMLLSWWFHRERLCGGKHLWGDRHGYETKMRSVPKGMMHFS
jgi:hypothetical protein